MSKLYPYQEAGVDWLLSGRRRYLADDMGLGKTPQALVAARRRGVKRVRVICPVSAIPNWHREAAVWGDPNWQFEAVSYASRAVHGRTGKWDHVILDEAHYVKSSSAQRTRHALYLAAHAGSAALLSGTPGRNASEVWTLFDALWPEYMAPEYRSEEDWREYFCTYREIPVGRYATRIKITGHRRENLLEFRHLLKSVVLRRTLEQVALTLPPLRVTLHTLPRTQVFTDVLAHGDHAAVLQAFLDEQVRDETSSSRLRRLLGQLKVEPIARLLVEELAGGQYQKIVVGYYHRDVGDTLARILRLFGVVRIDGATPPAKRQSFIDQFNQDKHTRVFLGQMTAAGEALNLQAASEVALVEPDWVPDPNRQFIKRVHRIGQTAPVRARVFGVEGTLDEEVVKNIALNTQLQEESGLR